MKASAVIVNYNTRPYLESCISSIINSTPTWCEIIVVDNHSSDDSVLFLQGIASERIKIIYNHTNLGFSQACNLGLREAQGDILLTMNPDVVVNGNWLERIYRHLQINSNTLAVGPKGVGIGGSQAAIPLCYAKNLAAADRKFAKLNSGLSERSKYLIGCLLVFERRFLDLIGYFDEQLPLGADDFDLALRIRKAGFDLRIARDVLIFHTVHASFKRSDSAACDALATRSWEHFNQKWASELNYFGWERLFEDKNQVFPGELPF